MSLNDCTHINYIGAEKMSSAAPTNFLKGQKSKLIIKPSALKGGRADKPKKGIVKLCAKRGKIARIKIHESIDVPPQERCSPEQSIQGLSGYCGVRHPHSAARWFHSWWVL
jgi:hypothetical protein